MRTRPLAAAAMMVVALLTLTAGPAFADQSFVKYYVVAEPGTYHFWWAPPLHSHSCSGAPS